MGGIYGIVLLLPAGAWSYCRWLAVVVAAVQEYSNSQLLSASVPMLCLGALLCGGNVCEMCPIFLPGFPLSHWQSFRISLSPIITQVQQGLARQRWPKGLLDDVPPVKESKPSEASIKECDAVPWIWSDAVDMECGA